MGCDDEKMACVTNKCFGDDGANGVFVDSPRSC